MFVLLILSFPVLEIWSLFKVGGQIGFVNTLFALVASGVFGMGLVKAQGRFILSGFQSSLERGEMPGSKALHSLLILLGGILLVIPGFFSDAVALILILPGTRHVVAFVMHRKLQEKLKSGSFRVFTMGGVGGNPFARPSPRSNSGVMRDVSPRELGGDIIDVTPISSQTETKE